MDYQRSLKFQIIPEETDVQPAQPTKSAKITIPEADETKRFLPLRTALHIHVFLAPNFFLLTT